LASLIARDAEHVLRFLSGADGLLGDDGFTPAFLDALGELVPADWVVYCEQDRVRQRTRRMIIRPQDEPVSMPVTYWEIADDHPVCRHSNRGEFRALKISDFLSAARLRSSRIYALWFRPWGVADELSIPIPSPPWHTKTFLFERRRGGFGERDRRVLDLLRPQLAQLWSSADMRRRLRIALAALGRAPESDHTGVIILDPTGRIELASPAAGRIVDGWFDTSPGARLPAEIAERLELSAKLRRVAADRSMTIERAGDLLLVEEGQPELSLTAREHQILAWVARGKTNDEVAAILWIQPGTVRKHLENIYAKLGVRSRTAAAARFLGVLDAKN
jgi:DNA-binding CsgD family transcriptional regulator